ncbi:MAG TPA: potassium channel family protein [Candidatus Dormibacteraeota bacterium]|nr:potassium channel family protein [Candidatus Dormibacteraeota bacterium]
MSVPTEHPSAAIRRYGTVLALLAAAITFAMVAPQGGWPRVVTALLQSGAVLAALSRAQASRRLLAAGVAAMAVTVAAAAAAAFGGRYEGAAADLAGAGLLVLVPTGIALDLRRHLEVTIQSVLAALCAYLVLGMLFASIAPAVSQIAGTPYFAGHTTANTSDYTYFSFVTLATIGYGDYVPALPLGRALAVLEGLAGQLYLVTVVALLVSNLGRRPARQLNDSSSLAGRGASGGLNDAHARGQRHPPTSPPGGQA